MSSRRFLLGLTLTVLFVSGLVPSAEAKLRRKRDMQRLATPTLVAAPKLVSVVYPVADLVIPIDMEAGVEKTTATLEEKLMRTITTAIAPASWKDVGGPGTIQYFPLGMAIVVSQTPAVQEEVQGLLQALRRLQDVEVAVELKVVTVSEAMMERLRADERFRADKNGIATLDARETYALLEALQGDRRASVMQMPKITVFNGQRAVLRAIDEHIFPTDVAVVKEGDKVTIRSKQEKWETGLKFAVRPVASADHRTVHVDLDLKLMKLEAHLPTTPVKTMVTIKDGNEVKEVPFEFQVQRPTVTTIGLERAFKVGDGQTAVLSAGKVLMETRQEFGPPVLSRIPYVNRLVRNVGYSREAMSLVVLVTPRVIINPETPAPTFQDAATPVPR